MPEITDKEYELLTKMKKILFHSSPELSGYFFICGEAGKRDENGLPETVFICPAFGVDWAVAYTKKPNGGEEGSTVTET